MTSAVLNPPAESKPAFSPVNFQIFFILGGPGSGKGTQCQRLVKEFPYATHISAGDLLRIERDRSGSPYRDLINQHIQEGKIVPKEITIALLRDRMSHVIHEGKKECRQTIENGHSSQGMECKQEKNCIDSTRTIFLIDGFPRQMDQALQFEETICPAMGIIFLDCPEKIMEVRLLKRGESGGRTDDNLDSIRKRFVTFRQTSMPVIEYYEKLHKVWVIDGSLPVKDVFEKVKFVIDDARKWPVDEPVSLE